MVRRFLLVFLFFGIAIVSVAQTVSPESAMQTARTFLQDHGRALEAAARFQSTDSQAVQGTPLYVFNAKQAQGFVIVSGDERTDEVLGYVENGTFDEATMPDNMRAWLQGYAEQIAALQRGEADAEQAACARRVSLHNAIAPMITTKWDQSAPYYLQCPTYSGNYCVTGCVATAMAQVMNYHEWPQSACTTIPAYRSASINRTLGSLSGVVFDWANMTDTYSNSSSTAEKNAVSQLMRYCGQAVEMDYTPSSSGASSDKVAMALRTYFNYDIGTRYVLRAGYTAQTWDELIYGELSQSRPVYYDGSSTGGGHAFVCDGYDGNGYYHINWGWGGYCDGFFKLSVLNPDGGGIGSSGTADGYAMNQGAVVGIQRPTGSTEDLRMLECYGMWYTGTTIHVSLGNCTGLSGDFNAGFAYRKSTSPSGSYEVYCGTGSLNPYSYFNDISVDVARLGLESGTYYFYPYSSLSSARGVYHIYGDEQLYIEVVVNNGSYNLTYHPIPNLSLISMENMAGGIVNTPQEIKVTMTNTGEEFNDIIYLFASQNASSKGAYKNKTGMVVESGATEEASLFFTPTSTGTWYVWVSLNEDGSEAFGSKEITIQAVPTGATNLSVESYEIDAHETTTVKVKIKNNASEGYYMPIYCYLFPNAGGESIDGARSGNLNLAAGQSVDLEYQFSGLTVGTRYFAFLRAYTNQSSEAMDWLGDYMFFTVTAPPSEEKPVTLTANSFTRKYGEANPTFTYEVSGEGTFEGTPDITCTATATSPVGTYPIVIAKGSVTNSQLTLVNGTLTIEAAPLNIAAGSYQKEQGEAMPELTLTYTGFKNSDTKSVLTKQPTVTCEATAESAPGTYAVIVSGAEAQNYDISYTAGVLTVTEATPVVVTAKSYTRLYGDQNPNLEYTTEGGTLHGTPSISCEATATSPVGQYDIVVSRGSVTNYNATYVNGTLSVKQAPLTIAAGNYEIFQGEALPDISQLTYTGFKNDETSIVLTRQPAVTCEATAESAPGEYVIRVGGAEATNYDITYTVGKLVIKAVAPVVVTAQSYSREYGEENPSFEYTIEGESLVGEPVISCEATPMSPVGQYPITITQGTINHANLTLVQGVLTVTTAPLTIAAGNYQKKQGEAMPEMKPIYTGFKNNETDSVVMQKPVISCEATEGSEPGEYTIVISGAEAPNYDISYVSGVLTVTEADPVTLTARSYTREYGEENPEFEFVVQGDSLIGQPIIACEATTASPVGQYDIVITQGTVGNYNVTYVGGTLTITPALLTVKVDSYTREEGEENPAFEISYAGWKLDETDSVLTTKPVATTTATKDSPAGDYAIVVSGGEARNYEFTYVDGVLTITAVNGIDAILASGQPFDVYTTAGVKVRHQVTELKGLRKGVYVINRQKVTVR